MQLHLSLSCVLAFVLAPGAVAQAPSARWDLNSELTWLEPAGALKDFGGEGRLNAVLSLTTRS
jgi:hypothetical protein